MAKATAKMKSTRSVVNHLLYGPNHLAFANSITQVCLCHHRCNRVCGFQYINTRINPFVDEWEKNKIFPAKVVFNELGKLGVFGVNKPIGWHLFGRCNIHLSGYGGLGLDFSYSVLVAETMGKINCGAIPMAIAVQVMKFPSVQVK